MKKSPTQSAFNVSASGSVDIQNQIRQAVANATLEGLMPSEHSIDLIRAVASGHITGEAALNSLHCYHGRHA